MQSEKYKKFFLITLARYYMLNEQNLDGLYLPLYCLLNYERVNSYLVLHNPLFIRRHRTADTFSDFELYEVRITNRTYVPLLLEALQIPER